MTESSGNICALLELIAKSLVDSPDDVFVELFDDGIIELEVAENDVGKVIGRQGRTARALRALLSAAGQRAHKRYQLEIIE
jgi:predicted RNA-binding protein YlqC (UPF0109 family)